MNTRTILSVIACCTFGFTSAYAEELTFANVIHKDARCNDPHGVEIYETVHIAAPTGKYFDKDTVTVYPEAGTRSFTDAAGPSGCFLQNLS